MKAYVETYFDNNAEVPLPLRRGALTLEQQLEVVLKEVHAFGIVPHLLWGLWSIKNSIDSKILFGYWVCMVLILRFLFIAQNITKC